MFSSFNLLPKEQDTETIEKTKKKVPPANFDEWLIESGYSDWPLEVDSNECKFDLANEFNKVYSKEDIHNKLKSKAAFQSGILDDLAEQLTSLRSTLSTYDSYFFNEVSKVTRKNDSPVENQKYRASFDLAKEQGQLQIENSQIQSLVNSKLKSIECATFPGFFQHELTPLPGSLEAPQLLDQITKLQDFTNIFKKVWRKYFLSEASVAILQDSFWWVFLNTKQYENGSNQKDSLFNRLAASFVNLFLTVPFEEQDNFFNHYPNCLSQAIYSAFYSAFPSSSSTVLDGQFRQTLVKLIYEWVTGSQPHIADVVDWWDIETLENKGIQELQDERAGQKLKSSLSFNEETFLDTTPGQRINEDGEIMHLFSPKLVGKISKSHPVGRGADVSKVAFNIYGRSPLVMHYLNSKGLSRQHDVMQKVVTRTELDETLMQDAVTYKELIRSHKKCSKLRKKNWSNASDQLNEQCKKIDQQKHRDIKSLARVHEELLAKQSDMKILSEKIMDVITRSDFTSKKLSSNIKNEKNNEPS